VLQQSDEKLYRRALVDPCNLKNQDRIYEYISQILSDLELKKYVNACSKQAGMISAKIARQCRFIKRDRQLSIISMHLNHKGMADLSSLGIVQVLPNLGLLQGLSVLSLSRNQIENLPESIGLLGSLKSLRLSENRIKNLPASIGLLISLKSLYLDRNCLTELPESIGNLKSLRTLNISSNQIVDLPNSLRELSSLANLEADHNSIRWLPIEVNMLPNLKRLQLGGNPLLSEKEAIEVVRLHDKSVPPFSLREMAARSVLRNNLVLETQASADLPFGLTRSVLDGLKGWDQCVFCKGPMIERKYIRLRHIWKNEQHIPFAYNLCEAHWDSERGRVIAMFNEIPESAPPVFIQRMRVGEWSQNDSIYHVKRNYSSSQHEDRPGESAISWLKRMILRKGGKSKSKGGNLSSRPSYISIQELIDSERSSLKVEHMPNDYCVVVSTGESISIPVVF
jgi:Leucine-rich repeat (LRR) protein